MKKRKDENNNDHHHQDDKSNKKPKLTTLSDIKTRGLSMAPDMVLKFIIILQSQEIESKKNNLKKEKERIANGDLFLCRTEDHYVYIDQRQSCNNCDEKICEDCYDEDKHICKGVVCKLCKSVYYSDKEKELIEDGLFTCSFCGKENVCSVCLEKCLEHDECRNKSNRYCNEGCFEKHYSLIEKKKEEKEEKQRKKYEEYKKAKKRHKIANRKGKK